MSDDLPQLTRADLKTMKPEEIKAARKTGQLDEVLAGRDRGASVSEYDRLIADKSPSEIVELRRSGALDDYLGRGDAA